MTKKINVSTVYCILNIYNGKRYVGSTSNFSDRKGQHLYDLRHSKHPSKSLQKDFTEMGENAIKFFRLEEVETFDQDELFDREQHWIDEYIPEYNGNLLAGNHFHPSAYTKEAKEKGIQTKKANGWKQSQEEKDKRALAIKKFWATHPAKTIPQDMRDHLSKINTGKKNPNWGLKRTPEQLQHQSDGRANIIYTFKSPSGEEVSVKNLSKCDLLPYGAMRNLYRGKTKEYKGWTFVGSEKVKR